MSEYHDTIERCRKHWQNLPPHVKERDTAKCLHDAIFIADLLNEQVFALTKIQEQQHEEIRRLRFALG